MKHFIIIIPHCVCKTAVHRLRPCDISAEQFGKLLGELLQVSPILSQTNRFEDLDDNRYDTDVADDKDKNIYKDSYISS